MRILGIHGSPHLDGNTAKALRRALDVVGAEGIETEYIALAEHEIAPCKGCFACGKGRCIHRDGMDAICEAMLRSDGLLLASPVYMGLPTGQMVTFMDRTVRFRTAGRFQMSGRVGAGIACGGFRNGGQELTLQSMHTYFLQQDMYAVADGPPFSHSGAAIGGRTQDDEVGLRTVDNVARRLARAVRQLRAGKP